MGEDSVVVHARTTARPGCRGGRGPLRAGAERLWMTQPPLSRRIKKLEEEVGVDLFEDPARGRADAGRAHLPRGSAKDPEPGRQRPALGQARRDRRCGHDPDRLHRDVGAHVLGSWINVAAAELPDVDIQLFELVTRHRVDALLAGGIDVGLARGVPLSDILAAKLIHSERLMLAAPIGHPLLALEGAVTLRDITAYDVVTYSPTESAYLYQLVVSAFGRFKTQPRYVQYVQQVNSVLATVNAGLGVALVPHTGIRSAIGQCRIPRHRRRAGLPRRGALHLAPQPRQPGAGRLSAPVGDRGRGRARSGLRRSASDRRDQPPVGQECPRCSRSPAAPSPRGSPGSRCRRAATAARYRARAGRPARGVRRRTHPMPRRRSPLR